MRDVALLLVGAVMLASGCVKVGPDFIPPPAPVSDDWLEKDEAELTSATDHHEEWWSVFDDPVLNGLVEEASRQNLGLQGAGLRILEARAQLGIATGNLYPQVQQLNAGAATVGGSRNAANSSGGDLSYKDLTASLDAAWELDFWENSGGGSSPRTPCIWPRSPTTTTSWLPSPPRWPVRTF